MMERRNTELVLNLDLRWVVSRLKESLRRAAYTKRCTERLRETTFTLPTQAVGRYVRWVALYCMVVCPFWWMFTGFVWCSLSQDPT